MSSLLGQLIKNTFRGLIKTADSDVVGATKKDLTDGYGNVLPMKVGTEGIDFAQTIDFTNATVTGLTVPPGPAGSSGTSGTSGVAGSSGVAGTSGTSGTSFASPYNGDIEINGAITAHGMIQSSNPQYSFLGCEADFTNPDGAYVAYFTNDSSGVNFWQQTGLWMSTYTPHGTIAGGLYGGGIGPNGTNSDAIILANGQMKVIKNTNFDYDLNVDGNLTVNGSPIIGQAGTSGTSGTSGAAGATGAAGSSGTSGTSGTSGAAGATGAAGSSGTSGTNGATGAAGTSGTSGTAGSSGTSGGGGGSSISMFNSIIAPASVTGGGVYPYYKLNTPALSYSGTTTTLGTIGAVNFMQFPLMPGEVIKDLAILVTGTAVAGTSITLGLYSSALNATNGLYADTLLTTFGTVDTSTTGRKTITNINYTVPTATTGQYWIALMQTGGASGVSLFAPANTSSVIYYGSLDSTIMQRPMTYRSGALGALPATITSAQWGAYTNSTQLVYVGLKS